MSTLTSGPYFLHEGGQVKALSTAGYTEKQIVDVVKRSGKAIRDFLCLQEEYGTRRSIGWSWKRTILRTASNNTISIIGIRTTCGIDASESTVWRIPSKCLNVVRSRMKKCPQLTQKHKTGKLCFGEVCAGSPTLFNSKFRWNKCYDMGRVPCCETDGLGVCLDEDERRDYQEVLASLSNKTMPQPAPVEAPRPSWRDNDVDTMDWPSRSSDLDRM
uniref:Tick transposon n=1 Tax=Heterorhabditis bacteriophora TaxID=37862 RepID=A0A1I7X4Z0_HETBA